jgi:hypothetical protein
MEKEIYGIAGVMLGIFVKALFDLTKMRQQHAHNKELREDKAEENVKALLIEMLSHKSHIDRSFDALTAKVAGFHDDEIRRLLMASVAQKVRGRDDEKEMYYLSSRQAERNDRMANKAAL